MLGFSLFYLARTIMALQEVEEEHVIIKKVGRPACWVLLACDQEVAGSALMLPAGPGSDPQRRLQLRAPLRGRPTWLRACSH